MKDKDKELVRGLRDGASDALEAVIEQYSAYVAAVIANQLGALATQPDVEELSADVFFSLWQSRARLQTAHLRGWLGAAARNRARSFLRKAGDIPVPLEDVIVLSGDSAAALLEAKERTRVVRKALAALGEPDREIFLRHYYYNETAAAIAGRTGLHPEAVKSRLRRGREKLKEILKQEGYCFEADDS